MPQTSFYKSDSYFLHLAAFRYLEFTENARFIVAPPGIEDASANARLSVVITFDGSGQIVEERFGN